MAYRILNAPKTRALERDCPECGAKMKGTGELYWDRTGWAVAFYCPKHREVFPMWKPEDKPLIEELTKGVDPETLPLMQPGHKP